MAAVGLIVNLISMRLLSGGSSESLNIKGAYFEVLSDMLGSLGVILAALIVMFTGWRLADPIVGAGIGLFIVPRTWSLLSQVTHILLEGTRRRSMSRSWSVAWPRSRAWPGCTIYMFGPSPRVSTR